MRSRSCRRLVGKGAREIGKRAIVAAAVERGEQAPSLGRDARRQIDRRPGGPCRSGSADPDIRAGSADRVGAGRRSVGQWRASLLVHCRGMSDEATWWQMRGRASRPERLGLAQPEARPHQARQLGRRGEPEPHDGAAQRGSVFSPCRTMPRAACNGGSEVSSERLRRSTPSVRVMTSSRRALTVSLERVLAAGIARLRAAHRRRSRRARAASRKPRLSPCAPIGGRICAASPSSTVRLAASRSALSPATVNSARAPMSEIAPSNPPRRSPSASPKLCFVAPHQSGDLGERPDPDQAGGMRIGQRHGGDRALLPGAARSTRCDAAGCGGSWWRWRTDRSAARSRRYRRWCGRSTACRRRRPPDARQAAALR